MYQSKGLVLTACVIFSGAAQLLAQPLADRVPANAVLYAGWRGSDEPGAGYDGSHLQAVLKASSFGATWEKLKPQIISKLTDGDADKAGQFDDVLAIASILRRHSTAVCCTGAEMAEHYQIPHTAVVCQASDDAQALCDLVKKLSLNSQANLKVAQLNDLVVVAFGVEDASTFLSKTAAESLAQAKAFQSALAEVDRDSAACAYIDFDRVFVLAEEGLKHADAKTRSTWPKVLDASGFGQLQRGICTGAFSEKSWSERSFLGISGAPKGLLAGSGDAKIDPALLARVPKQANYVQYTRFDPAKLLADVRNITAAADPDAAAMFDKSMGAAQMMLGKNLQTDIFEPLGPQWALYTAPAVGIGTNNVVGMVMVNKLDDSAKAKAGLVALTYGLNNMAARALLERGAAVKLQQKKLAGDVTEFYFETTQPEVSPGWVIKDSMLYIGGNHDAVAAAAMYDTKGENFGGNEKFNRLRDQLKPGADGEFTYADLPDTVADLYKTMDQSSAAGLQALRSAGIELDKLPLPSLEVIQRELAPFAKFSWLDGSGFHSRALKPFPAADLLAAQNIGGLTTVGTSALLVSVALPSLNRARETANRVKCASNERQIGMACLLYSNENKGKYPPDLGTLIMTEDITWQPFTCPDTDTALPNNVLQGEAIAKWVNDHSDFVYVGQNLTSNSPDNKIVLYENMDHHGDGCNILFKDGHVEFVLKRAAADWIKAGEAPARPQ